LPYAVIYIWNLKQPTKLAEKETNLWLPEVEGKAKEKWRKVVKGTNFQL